MTLSTIQAHLSNSFQQALQHHAAGQLAQAERLYRAVLAALPRHAPSLSNLALIQLATGNTKGGATLLEKSLEIDANQSGAWNNLALVLAHESRHNDALDCFAKSLALEPGHAQTLFGRAGSLLALDRTLEAIGDLRAAVAADPNFYLAQVSLGEALAKAGAWEEARTCFLGVISHPGLAGDATQLQPLRAKVWCNVGICEERLANFEAALEGYARAVELDATTLDAVSLRATLLRDLGRTEEAKAAEALWATRAASDPHRKVMQAFDLLANGEFAEGWALHEARLELPALEVDHARAFGTSELDETTNINNKVVLVYGEQGLGDTLQFYPLAVHFALRTKDAGVRVVLEVQPGLGELLATLKRPPNLSVTERQAAIPAHDVHVPLMSLPHHLQVLPQHLPLLRDYIWAPQPVTEKWQAALPPVKAAQPRVGIVWSGSTWHRLDSYRSIDLATFASVLHADWQWHSLQKEVRSSDADQLDLLVAQGQLIDHSASLVTMTDTAALISHLDLVITVDTSVAHLAAAMGKPTWILLGWRHDFRWMKARDDSAWYPSVKLWRQAPEEPWSKVLLRAKEALAHWKP